MRFKNFRVWGGGSGQDGGVGRNALLPQTPNQKKNNNQFKSRKQPKVPEIELHGTLTTKELKKHSPVLVEGAEMGDRQLSGEDVCGKAEDLAG